jgi:hypothetical protein
VVLAQEDVGHAKYVTPLSSILVVHALGVACRSNPVMLAKPSWAIDKIVDALTSSLRCGGLI